ncbi:hypothetical protein GCM10011492_26260 [Flexivirga endophytica]|uniref:Uncharacterized protein n=1 Tax=Flexivirga endophytica TaxID=1849103 RepID=A0A916WVQ3_9MICO|nr:hypothetical protein GCM10011492_26260 [Flexivirga endophytica]
MSGFDSDRETGCRGHLLDGGRQGRSIALGLQESGEQETTADDGLLEIEDHRTLIGRSAQQARRHCGSILARESHQKRVHMWNR